MAAVFCVTRFLSTRLALLLLIIRFAAIYIVGMTIRKNALHKIFTVLEQQA